MRIPASELMRAYQQDVRECARSGIEFGMPVHVQHDMHRLVGWSRPLGLYIDGSMVRSLGQIETPSTESEKAELHSTVDEYWARYHREGAKDFSDELRARMAPANLEGARVLVMESVVVSRAGIAEELFPELFTPGLGLVDKDGLADYRDLVRSMKQVQPGVFHHSGRDVLLFAHRFFRRSLSHRNKLNAYFLESFGAVAKEHGGLRIRIKLDPDILGHPASARELIEMEYWRGHRYSDEIASIPSSVAEHKADERCRRYHGIDRTQVWWKGVEKRSFNGGSVDYRTFEIEELIENESGGLAPNNYGCRYAHAEFSEDHSAITHFDGAIRAYGSAAYFERIDTSIDRAGKHADYTKVFRLDGVLKISDWKLLLTDYFQGNSLIPEYLGAPTEREEFIHLNPDQENIEPGTEEVELVALISLTPASIMPPISLYLELSQQWGRTLVPVFEIGAGAVNAYLRTKLDLTMITTVGFEDGNLNLSRLCFGPTDHSTEFFSEVVAGLAEAIRLDIDAGLIRRASIPLTWCVGEIMVTLTIAGKAGAVADALLQIPRVVDLSLQPSEWIEAVSDLVRRTAPNGVRSAILWHGVGRGVISIERTGEVEQRIRMPAHIQERLIAAGDLKIHQHPESQV